MNFLILKGKTTSRSGLWTCVGTLGYEGDEQSGSEDTAVQNCVRDKPQGARVPTPLIPHLRPWDGALVPTS